MLVAVALPSQVANAFRPFVSVVPLGLPLAAQVAARIGSKLPPLPSRRFSAVRAHRSAPVIDELPEFFHQPIVFAAQFPLRHALPNEQLNPAHVDGVAGSPNEPVQVSGVVAIVPGGCTSVTVRLSPGVSGKL